MNSVNSFMTINNILLILTIIISKSNGQTGQDEQIIRKGPLSDSQLIESQVGGYNYSAKWYS